MDAAAFIAGLALAGLGQWINTLKNAPTLVVKLVMAVVGAGLYALLVAHPPAAPPSPAFSAWLNGALLWAFALPGVASLIGTVPGMKTDSR